MLACCAFFAVAAYRRRKKKEEEEGPSSVPAAEDASPPGPTDQEASGVVAGEEARPSATPSGWVKADAVELRERAPAGNTAPAATGSPVTRDPAAAAAKDPPRSWLTRLFSRIGASAVSESSVDLDEDPNPSSIVSANGAAGVAATTATTATSAPSATPASARPKWMGLGGGDDSSAGTGSKPSGDLSATGADQPAPAAGAAPYTRKPWMRLVSENEGTKATIVQDLTVAPSAAEGGHEALTGTQAEVMKPAEKATGIGGFFTNLGKIFKRQSSSMKYVKEADPETGTLPPVTVPTGLLASDSVMKNLQSQADMVVASNSLSTGANRGPQGASSSSRPGTGTKSRLGIIVGSEGGSSGSTPQELMRDMSDKWQTPTRRVS